MGGGAHPGSLVEGGVCRCPASAALAFFAAFPACFSCVHLPPPHDGRGPGCKLGALGPLLGPSLLRPVCSHRLWFALPLRLAPLVGDHPEVYSLLAVLGCLVVPVGLVARPSLVLARGFVGAAVVPQLLAGMQGTADIAPTDRTPMGVSPSSGGWGAGGVGRSQPFAGCPCTVVAGTSLFYTVPHPKRPHLLHLRFLPHRADIGPLLIRCVAVALVGFPGFVVVLWLVLGRSEGGFPRRLCWLWLLGLVHPHPHLLVLLLLGNSVDFCLLSVREASPKKLGSSGPAVAG